MAEEERSTKYGLIGYGTRKPVEAAAADLAKAINTLEKHHDEEFETFDKALADLIAVAPAIDSHVQSIQAAVEALRARREAFLTLVRPMKETTADVIVEAHMHAGRGLLAASVEAEEMGPGPVAPSGLQLTSVEALRVLDEVYGWTRRATYGIVVAMIGPAYLLGRVIEWPTDGASALRKAAREVETAAIRFINTEIK